MDIFYFYIILERLQRWNSVSFNFATSAFSYSSYGDKYGLLEDFEYIPKLVYKFTYE